MQGSVAGIQLAHAGRKASHYSPWKNGAILTENDGAWNTFAPSEIPYKNGEPSPVEMTKDDIKKFVNDFSSAASRALKAGFKVIEIHAAHGYLLNEFLSPLSNNRTDEYGGSLTNRIRILLEVISAVREVMNNEIPLFLRLSVTDWVDGGWNDNDSVGLVNIVKDMGVDLIDCSSGGNSPFQNIPVEPLYQVRFAEQIKKKTAVLTAAVGLITKAEEAECILQDEKADLIFFGRQMLRDPYFPLHAAKDQQSEISWPDQYARAK